MMLRCQNIQNDVSSTVREGHLRNWPSKPLALPTYKSFQELSQGDVQVHLVPGTRTDETAEEDISGRSQIIHSGDTEEIRRLEKVVE